MNQNRIAPLRREANMNQRELGQRLGVGQTTISAWETGKNEPDSQSMNKMAQLFHVSIGYLMGYERDNGRRGLSAAEWKREQEAIKHRLEQEELQRTFDADQAAERLSLGVPSDKELKELEENELYQQWLESGLTCFFETFKLNSYFEYLTEAQRKRIVAIVEQMFPNVIEGKYLDEVIHE